jgi:ribulose-phosphate 3-epimerase
VVKIIPTVLEKSIIEAEKRIIAVKGKSKWIQIDVIDGTYLPQKSFELELVDRIEGVENVLWEVHLMVKEPVKWLEKCVFIGASRVTGQVEMMSDREEFVKECKDAGMEAGLAFDIGTEVNNIPEETDVVLLMGRKAGFGWSEMNKDIYKKIDITKIMRKDRDFLIGVDGGVTAENINKLEDEGVDIVYSGNEFEKIDDENE